MRLFVAVELPEAWRDAARAVRAALEQDVEIPLRWVDPALLHITLRFLGEVDEERVASLQQALSDVAPVDVAIAVEAAGTFGSPARTSVVWLGVGGDGEGLHALAGRVEAAVVAAGLPPDERPFRAHVTLARVGRRAGGAQRRALAKAVAGLTPPPPASFRARDVLLVRSHLGPRGPRYEVLSRHG